MTDMLLTAIAVSLLFLVPILIFIAVTMADHAKTHRAIAGFLFHKFGVGD